MATMESEYPKFLRKYGSDLETLARKLREEEIDYIIAIPRKSPRLLELCELWGIDYGDTATVITSRALDFIDDSLFAGKKVIILDDIVIVGSTIAHTCQMKSILEKACIFCLMRHDKWFTKRLFSKVSDYGNENDRVYCASTLGQRDAAVFCTELVQSIAHLNKPYDLDHPIFYTRITHEYFEEICIPTPFDTLYEISTPFQRSIGKRRFSYIPTESAEAGFINLLFKNSKSISPQVIKCRLYYDELTQSANFVPMLIFHASRTDIEDDKLTFREPFNEYNALIARVINEKSDVQDTTYEYYRLLSYVTSYLYGLSFFIRNLNSSDSLINYPSHFLSIRDLHYLFGPVCSEQLLHSLNSLYARTARSLHDIHASELGALSLRKSVGTTRSPDPFNDDSEAQKLLNEIKPYLDSHIHKRQSLMDKMACIFEALFLVKEIPARHRIKDRGTLEGEEHRLEMGFSRDQIFKILTEYGAINPQEGNPVIRLSLLIDILVDRGVMVPFYKERGGRFERLYRYGEDGLRQLTTKYLLARVLQDLFEWIVGSDGQDYIPKISLEKILVMLTRKLRNSPEDVDHLRLDGTMGLRTISLDIAYWIHGAITEVELETKGGKPVRRRLTDWLTTDGILKRIEEETERSWGYKYCEEFLNSVLAEGEENAEDNSMVPDDMISEYRMLTEVLWYTKKMFDELHQQKKSTFNGDDALICLSTCLNAESTLDAMREELVYLFTEDLEEQELGAGYCMQRLLSILNKQFIGDYLIAGKTEATGLWEKCDRQLKNADEAANSLLLKYTLFRNRGTIIRLIKEHFQTPQVEHYLKTYYQHQLKNIADSIARDAPSPLTTSENDAFRKLKGIGEHLTLFTEILKICSSVTNSLIAGPRTVQRRLHKATQSKVMREVAELKTRIEALNKQIEENDISFSGIEISKFPPIKQILISDKHIPKITEWAEAYRDLVTSMSRFWHSMTPIYDQNYSSRLEAWPAFKSIVYPKDTHATNLRWSIWYDIKDSQGERNAQNAEKCPSLKDEINRVLKHAADNIKDGQYTKEPPEKDDQKYIHTVKGESILSFLKLLLQTVDGFGMFVRVGIAGADDTGVPFFRIPDSSLLDSERNFALPKRLGECINRKNIEKIREYNKGRDIPEETDDAHTVVISNEAWRKIWKQGTQLGSPCSVKYEVVNMEREVHIFAQVPRGANIQPNTA